jgi:Leucine-rich repeat (LRR) protein
MSIPTVQRTIDVMRNFTGIEILIITSGKGNVSVDLSDILQKASHYPLKELYIINFGQFVSTIPGEVNQFKDLTTLGLFNNDLAKLPESDAFASNLSSLSIDINPIYTLFPDINSFKNLKTLSIAKTSISDSEIISIKELLPDCEIITE